MADLNKELIYSILLEYDEYKKGMQEVESATTKAQKEIENTQKKVAEAEKKVALYATAMTTALSAVAVASVNMANDFNDGFAKVQTLIPDSTERIKELQENVLELSPAVGKTTTDLTEGLYEIVSAFGDSADSAKTLEIAAKAATAGGATTKEAISLLSAVTKGYGDTTAEAQKKVSDLAFMTLKLGQTSMTDLAASMQRVTAMSNTLGVSQEELFAVFSAGTGVIGGAAEVSTQLSAVYTEMLKPGERLAGAFAELGVATGQELIDKMGGITGALDALKGVADKTGEPISNLFGSVEAGKIALYTTGAGAEKLANDLQAMSDVAGSTEQAFDKVSSGGVNSFGFQLEQMKLNAQKASIKLGQELIPALQALLKPVMSLVNFVANANPATMAIIGTLTKLAIVVGVGTVAIMTKKVALEKAKVAQEAFNRAIKANPLGVMATAIVGVITVLKSLIDWMDKARQKALEEKLSIENANQERYRGVVAIQQQIDAWTELNAIQNKNAAQVREQQKLEEQIRQTLNIKPQDKNVADNKRLTFKDEVLKAKEQVGLYTAQIAEKEKELEQTKAEIKKRKDEISNRINSDFYGLEKSKIDEMIKKRENENKELQRLNELLKEQTETLESQKDAMASLQAIEFKPPKEKAEIEAPPEKTKKKGKAEEAPLKKSIREQTDRLKALDDAYKREAAIIENSKLTTAQKAKEKKEAESKYFDERLKLLKTFVNERMQAGASYESAVAQMLKLQGKTITAEMDATYTELGRIAKEKLEAELAEINKIAKDKITEVEKESAKKFDKGDFGNKKSSDAQKAKLKYEIVEYETKSLELQTQITVLAKEDVEANKEKINALKAQKDQIDKTIERVKDDLQNVKKTGAEVASEVAKGIQAWGEVANNVVQGMAGIATDVIGQKQKAEAQRLADELAEIEREKNETLMELENEYLDWKEEKQIEQAEREEERREAEYEKQMEFLTRSLNETQAAFDQETNTEKAKNKEKELESKRKEKAEEMQKKKEADAERKRQKEERKQEIEMLNAKAQAQWSFQVATIEAQNASAQSMASLARQQAQWEKAASITSLTTQLAINTAMMAAKIAEGTFNPAAIASIAAYATAMAVDIAQIGVVSATPLPSGTATNAPLPPAPRPIKFARGGIVYPSAGGTNFALANGTPAVAGEAGTPEIILPVTQENLEAVFKSQGITNNNATNTIAPTYHITIMNEQGAELKDTIMQVLDDNNRELLAIVENTKRNTYVGD